LERKDAAVPAALHSHIPIVVKQAVGGEVEDLDGNRFIDFAGGIGALNVGHTNPEVVAAVKEQVELLTHMCMHVAAYEPYVALAERVNSLVPVPEPKKTLFVNSGAEAVENAVKIARYATGRPAVIVFEHGFHGRTLLTLSLTGKVSPYKKGFGPFVGEVYRTAYPYVYRCPVGDHPDAALRHYVAVLHDLFKTQVDPVTVAAVVFEPILGEGGFVQMPPAYLEELFALCQRHGIVTVVDEVQSGWGRSGRMFAIEHYDVEPDIVVTAKSIAGGLPLASVTARAELVDHIHPGGLGSTFGGNPISCAAALAAIRVIEENQLVKRAEKIGQAVRARFEEWKERFPAIGDVRGLGAMNAIEFVRDRATKEPDSEAVSRIHHQAYERGLILLKAGTYQNVVRTLMPLTIEDEILEEGLEILEQAMEEALR
jgi:4-aminobutyrate aminotransferase/(S)-3-amino-2-methylpropionate transaminase